jgi:hypothetical protein
MGTRVPGWNGDIYTNIIEDQACRKVLNTVHHEKSQISVVVEGLLRREPELKDRKILFSEVGENRPYLKGMEC